MPRITWLGMTSDSFLSPCSKRGWRRAKAFRFASSSNIGPSTVPRRRGLGDATDVSDNAARRACIAVFTGHIVYDAIASEMACDRRKSYWCHSLSFQCPQFKERSSPMALPSKKRPNPFLRCSRCPETSAQVSSSEEVALLRLSGFGKPHLRRCNVFERKPWQLLISEWDFTRKWSLSAGTLPYFSFIISVTSWDIRRLKKKKMASQREG